MPDFGAVYAAWPGRMNRHDCWDLCHGAHRCCQGHQDLLLLPGEGDFLRAKGLPAKGDRLRCVGRESCFGALRPICCRTFPLHPGPDGRLLANTSCSEYRWASWHFIEQCERAWRSLLCSQAVWDWAMMMRGGHYGRWNEVAVEEIQRPFDAGYAAAFQRYFYVEAATKLLHWGVARPGQWVLDAGCGDGRRVALLAQHGIQSRGVDVNRALLQGASPRCWYGDVRDLEMFAEQEFDGAFCIDVLEHVADYDRAIRELLRVARQWVYIQVTTTEMWENLLEDPTHVVRLSTAEWRTAIASQARIVREPMAGGFLLEVHDA